MDDRSAGQGLCSQPVWREELCSQGSHAGSNPQRRGGQVTAENRQQRGDAETLRTPVDGALLHQPVGVSMGWDGELRNGGEFMQPVICRCCGLTMKNAGHANPNVCSGCEQWPNGHETTGLEGQVSVEGADVVSMEQRTSNSEHIIVKAA